MEYIIPISIILIYSSILTIILKKRIEQTIPISIVCITLIIYIAGMFDNLRLGVTIVGIVAIAGIATVLYVLCKEKETEKVKEKLKRILTPGVVAYILLCIGFIYINKNRVFENYDEFNHWARIIKNMFVYNTYGVNEETIVYFNEYPPFTAIFQYIFLAVKNIYREDVILTAQCILYLSIVIPITRNIKWDKSLRNLIILIPSIIFIPMIFYENFYLNILVDGILGVMFGSVIYTAYKEKDINYKYAKIFSLLVMLALTKTSGIALVTLAVIIIAIEIIKNRKNNINFRKEIRNLAIVITVVTILTTIWYIKTNESAKRWDFNQYIETENKTIEEQKGIVKSFINAVINQESITNKEITVLIMFFILLCLNFYTLKKAKEQGDKDYRYYSIAMLISIPIYMIFLLITYATIFDIGEAQRLTCFDRYSSTILLANVIFQLFSIFNFSTEFSIKKVLIVFTIIASLIPTENIYKKYIDGKNYVLVSNIDRNIYTKFRLYSNKVDKNEKVLFIVKETVRKNHLKAMNEYQTNMRISEIMVADFTKEQDLENIAKQYDYIFVYRMKEETKEEVKELFENNTVKNDTLYKVVNNSDKIAFERIRK